MALLEFLAGDESLQHPPGAFGDVASRLADHAHFGLSRLSASKSSMTSRATSPGNPETLRLDCRNDTFAGNVARGEEGARPLRSAQNLERRQPDLFRVETEIIEAALLASRRPRGPRLRESPPGAD